MPRRERKLKPKVKLKRIAMVGAVLGFSGVGFAGTAAADNPCYVGVQVAGKGYVQETSCLIDPSHGAPLCHGRISSPVGPIDAYVPC